MGLKKRGGGGTHPLFALNFDVGCFIHEDNL